MSYTSRFTMMKDNVAFQFGVDVSAPNEVVRCMNLLIDELAAAGYACATTSTPVPVRPATTTSTLAVQTPAPSVPMTGQAPAMLPPKPLPALPAGAKTDAIDGYVIGQYHSKKHGKFEPCVWLYTARRPFKAYTIFPEAFDLLPFGVHSLGQLVVAPSRADAMQSGIYVTMPFDLPIEPDVDPATGKQRTSPRGYPEFRPARVTLVQPPPAPPAPPVSNGAAPAPAPVPVASKAALFSGVPIHKQPADAPGEGALYWTMQDTETMLTSMAIPEVVEAWFYAYREYVIGHLPMAGKPTQESQWLLLNQWCADQLGLDDPTATVPVIDRGDLPLAGVLVGMVCDRYAEKPGDAPVDVVLDLLRRTQPTRGVETNPAYDAKFAGALSLAYQGEFNRIASEGTLAF